MVNAVQNITFTESFWCDDGVAPYLSDMDIASGVRNQILEALDQCGLAVDHALMLKLAKTTEITALWFLRIDIMQTLSLRLSEEQARSTMGHITALFVGLMPDSVFVPSHYAIRTQNSKQNSTHTAQAEFETPDASLFTH